MTVNPNNKVFLERCKSMACFKLVFNENELLSYSYQVKYDFFKYFWNKYETFTEIYKSENNKSINNTYNGQAYTIIIAYLLHREKIKIKSMDEEIINVPFVKPDFIFLSDMGRTIFLSIKTSLRERWKQADWEAIKYKEKESNAACILLSNNLREVKAIKSKLNILSLDEIYYTNKEDLESFFIKYVRC
jgi:hypothetical protein